jgi:Protein of unknown function (DUF2934)
MSDIGQERERRIRECAYLLWKRDGCPEGRADFHWQSACVLVAEQEASGSGSAIEEEDNLPASGPPPPGGVAADRQRKRMRGAIADEHPASDDWAGVRGS